MTPTLSHGDLHAYLDRIGIDAPAGPGLDALMRLQLAHLQAVPFENLAIFAGRSVTADNNWTFSKVVDQMRGGWCFELNGAFAQLLEAVGFTVHRLAAAVLLGGPNQLVDHLVLEVVLDQPYLVEVGFGDNAPIVPLPLQAVGPIETRCGTFEFLNSPQGTTLAQLVDGVPEARYRFKRVNHQPRDFEPVSMRLQSDPALHWSTSPFATRLLDDQGTRIILTRDRLKTCRGNDISEQSVDPDDWNDVLFEHFGIVESVPPEALERRPDYGV
ncbi:MAG: arylamine N-acetyltransferase [Acidimicrobiaceae bacterium]|nr:arylamine N-acetyltransferase [Acidimicrobiaceae bacterium]